MKLSELIAAVPEAVEFSELKITGITSDSGKVQPGYVFFAMKGEKNDGAKFIPQAEQNGAAIVFAGRDSQIGQHKIPVIILENNRLALARMASVFYGAQPQHIVAVTGTDGKTSTADFFRQLMFLDGKKSASMGTIGVISGEGKDLFPGTLTTPDPVELHRMLAEIAKLGVQQLAMEASSHGLDQYRLDGVRLQAAAFTNIARDHLDYHKTEDAYFLAKSRLFGELLPEGKTAVLNQDDVRFPQLKEICRKRKHEIIGFGHKGAEFAVNTIKPNQHGQSVALTLFGKKHKVEVPLVGEFQVMNILAALGLVIGVGGNLEKTLANIPKLKGVAGRLEQVVTTKNGATVFIDYAHTPLALANILNTLRPHTEGKLHVVFGCGGDRDAGKRPLMGQIGSELADITVITDDNPRSEKSETIRAAVMAGCIKPCKEVADRAEAIYFAIEQLGAGDVLVIAGKGHEKMQIIGDKHIPFDDGEVARNAARSLGVAA